MVTENPARTPSRKRGPAGNSFCDDSPPSPTFVPGHNHRRIMQNIERPTYCQPCQKPTNHQIRYRSDPDFVGRVLVWENCEQGKLVSSSSVKTTEYRVSPDNEKDPSSIPVYHRVFDSSPNVAEVEW